VGANSERSLFSVFTTGRGSEFVLATGTPPLQAVWLLHFGSDDVSGRVRRMGLNLLTCLCLDGAECPICGGLRQVGVGVC